MKLVQKKESEDDKERINGNSESVCFSVWLFYYPSLSFFFSPPVSCVVVSLPAVKDLKSHPNRRTEVPKVLHTNRKITGIFTYTSWMSSLKRYTESARERLTIWREVHMEKGKEEKGGRKSKEEEDSELKIDFLQRGSVCSLTLWFSVISTQKKEKPTEEKNKDNKAKVMSKV